MFVKRILIIALIGICAIGAGFGCSKLDRDAQLSEPPRNYFQTREFSTKPSSFSVNIRLPFDELSVRANQAAPKTYQGHGVGKRKCKRIIGIKTCGTPEYDYVVKRGEISVTAGPANSIRLSVPLAISGHGGYQGKGAKLFGLQSKQFKASLQAVSDISLTVANNWCPQPTIRADFEWIEGAKIELFRGVWVGVRSMVEPRLKEKIAELSNSVAKQIDCEDIRRKLQTVWTKHSWPIQIGDTKEPNHLNISPEQIGFSGLVVDRQAVNFAVHLVADARISATPANTDPMPLPPPLPELHSAASSADSALAVSLPTFVSYEQVRELIANRLMKAPIRTETSAGDATLTTRDVNVYPSGEKLVIAALLDVDLPTQLFDVSGWVYLTTTPRAENNGTALRLAEPTFSRDVNSKTWRLVSVVLEQNIKDGLSDWGVIDLNESISKAKDRLAEQVATPRLDFSLDVGDPQLRLGEIAVTANQLVIETIFRSRADIALKGM